MATVISGTTGISANAAQFLIGQVVFMAGANAPSGFLKCNGQLVSRTTYASLFAVIGTTYGAGDGSTTFAVPDLRGEFIRCLDDGRGEDSGRALGTWQSDATKSHTHTSSSEGSHSHTTQSAGSHTHGINDPGHSHALSMHSNSGNSGTSSGGNGVAGNSGSTNTATTGISIQSAGAHTHTVDAAGAHSHTIGSTGGAETRPRNVALLACIFTGV